MMMMLRGHDDDLFLMLWCIQVVKFREALINLSVKSLVCLYFLSLKEFRPEDFLIGLIFQSRRDMHKEVCVEIIQL
jgi:hypothetical protein